MFISKGSTSNNGGVPFLLKMEISVKVSFWTTLLKKFADMKTPKYM